MALLYKYKEKWKDPALMNALTGEVPSSIAAVATVVSVSTVVVSEVASVTAVTSVATVEVTVIVSVTSLLESTPSLLISIPLFYVQHVLFLCVVHYLVWQPEKLDVVSSDVDFVQLIELLSVVEVVYHFR